MADDTDTVEYPGLSQFYDHRGMFRNPVNNDVPTITDPNDLAQGPSKKIFIYDPDPEMIELDSPEKRAKSSIPRRESDKTQQKGFAQPKSEVKSKAQHQSTANNKEDDFEPFHGTEKALKNEPSPSSEERVNLSKPSSETNNPIPHWLENAPRILKKANEINRLAKENPDAWLQQHEHYPRQLLGLFAVQASLPLTGLFGIGAGGFIGGGSIVSTVVGGAVSGGTEVLIYHIVDDSTAEDYLQGILLGTGGAIFGRYVLIPVFSKLSGAIFQRSVNKWKGIDKKNVLIGIEERISPSMVLPDHGYARFKVGIQYDEGTIYLKEAFREKLPNYVRSSTIFYKQIISMKPDLSTIKTIVNDCVINPETISSLNKGGSIENTLVGRMTLKVIRLLGLKQTGPPIIEGEIGEGMDFKWPVSK